MAAPSTSSVAAKMEDVKLRAFSYPQIEAAFAERPDLKERIYNMIPRLPRMEELFIDIAQFIVKNRDASLANTGVPDPSKKRKLNALQSAATGDSTEKIMFEDWKPSSFGALPDISFSIPQRKKLRLEIGFLPNQGLRARNAASDEIEFTVRWRDIQYITCLPVPEKAQAQYMFCVFPLNTEGINNSKPTEGKEPAEQILWTVSNAILEPSQILWGLGLEEGETYRSLFLRVLNRGLIPFRKQVEVPNEKEFACQTAQAYRTGEKAVHVKAFRGSKDGFLFFLRTGIFWGFKKPLMYFSFESISTVSYTSILQRTFNLNLSVHTSVSAKADADSEPQDFEFSMIDQADFNGIDAYVKRHGLQDASMARDRRAKRFNVNGKDEDGHGEDGDEEGKEGTGEKEGELEKARREMEDAEDAEDEEDENFDPGSEGESEGSGSSSEEEEGEGNGGGEEEGNESEDEEEDLIARELGSEGEELPDV